jgi:tryptophan synthase alpha chain
MNRIRSKFAQCHRENRKALVPFICAGDPSLELTAQLLPTLADAGADIIELGVPFSDPMADGPTIQAASERAVANGTTLPQILELAREFRKTYDTPLVLFSYFNPILQYGVEKLAAACGEIGIDAWLVVDVPTEEQDEIRPVLRRHGLDWVTLLAPTTPRERAAQILKDPGVFVYYITVTGVTGARSELPADLKEHLNMLKDLTDAPIVAGFGIATPEAARQAAEYADGAVVGSALVKKIAAAENSPAALAATREFIAGLAQALKA